MITDIQPLTPTTDELESGRFLFSGNVEFVRGVTHLSHLPTLDQVEVCFIGRSNVGKSSLINALTNRKNLARTSNTPGRTREINYFQLRTSHFLVDLPGYGYAKLPPPIVAKHRRLITAYFRVRPTLRRAFTLVDARHLIKPVDHEIFKILTKFGVPFQIVATKCDKLSSTEQNILRDGLSEIYPTYPAAVNPLVMTSAKSRNGIDVLRSIIASIQ